jgi:hypothetical protein
VDGCWPNEEVALVGVPNEKGAEEGVGGASLGRSPNPDELEAPKPLLAEPNVFVVVDPNPLPLVLLAPKENPDPVLAALKEEPPPLVESPPRMGLASMLSSSRVFVKGVVGPEGKTSPPPVLGADDTGPLALLEAGAPNANPVFVAGAEEGAPWPKLNELDVA